MPRKRLSPVERIRALPFADQIDRLFMNGVKYDEVVDLIRGKHGLHKNVASATVKDWLKKYWAIRKVELGIESKKAVGVTKSIVKQAEEFSIIDELTWLYGIQKARVTRAYEVELKNKTHDPNLVKEIAMAANLIKQSADIHNKLNILTRELIGHPTLNHRPIDIKPGDDDQESDDNVPADRRLAAFIGEELSTNPRQRQRIAEFLQVLNQHGGVIPEDLTKASDDDIEDALIYEPLSEEE